MKSAEYSTRPSCGLFVLLTMLMTLGCAGTGQDTRMRPLPLPAAVDTALYPDAGAVFLEDRGVCRLYQNKGRSQTILERHIVIQILNERGYDYANVSLPYHPGSRISHISAQTVLPDGRRLALRHENIFDSEMTQSSMLYTRQRVKRFTMPGVRPGAVISYSWRLTLDSFDLWPIWTFQREEPVLHSRFELELPKTHTVRWRQSGPADWVRFSSHSMGSHVRYAWTADSLPPFQRPFGAPPGEWTRSMIRFSPLGAETWQDVGQWYLNQASQAMKPGPETQQIARSLDEIDQPLERLHHLYQYVQDNIRYIAVATTESGFTPHSADDVLLNGYGDCKDMVTALIGLGRELNINIHPVLLSTWPHGRADSLLITPHQFNHMVAVASLNDSTRIWMDPTEKRGGFGQLPWYDQNRLALHVDIRTKRHRLITTPAYPPEYHLSDRHWIVQIDRSGLAQGSVSYFLYGAPAMELRRQLAQLPPSARSNYIASQAFGRFPLQVEPDIQIEHLDEVQLPLILSARFVSPHLVLKSQDLYTLFPDATSTFDYHRLFLNRDRYVDIEMKHPITLSDHITLHLPEAWKLLNESPGDTLETAFGRYSWHIESETPIKYRLERFFTLPVTRIDCEQYQAFRSFLNQVALYDQTLILFDGKSVKNGR